MHFIFHVLELMFHVLQHKFHVLQHKFHVLEHKILRREITFFPLSGNFFFRLARREKTGTFPLFSGGTRKKCNIL